MRLIDAGEFRNHIRKYSMDCYEQGDVLAAQVFEDVISEIDDAPTIDTVKHGRWIKDELDGGGDYCSVCKSGTPGLNANHKFVYCPYCGVKMDLED